MHTLTTSMLGYHYYTVCTLNKVTFISNAWHIYVLRFLITVLLHDVIIWTNVCMIGLLISAGCSLSVDYLPWRGAVILRPGRDM